jgi:hypothetical protein
LGDEVDIWLLPEELPLKAANYQTWESFKDSKKSEPCNPYITEAGLAVFDAAIAGDRDYIHVKNDGVDVVDSKIYTSSLFSLGLGRNSVLFTWDEDKRSFKSTLPSMRLSGYTAESLNGVLSIFLDCGNITKLLHAFVDNTYRESKSPGQVALADAISTLLSTLQTILNESASQPKSVLQLRYIFEPPHAILTCFQRIINNTARTRSDESMLSTIFEEIQLQEHRADSLGDILIEILSRVSHPWLEFVGEWLGVRREAGLPLTKEGNGKSFVSVADKEWVDDLGLELKERDYILDYDRVPSFVAPEDARALFEVGKSLRYLRTHHTTHPLTRPEFIAAAGPSSLEWKFGWQDIMAVESKALVYEKNLTEAIARFRDDPLSTNPLPAPEPYEDEFKLDFFGKPEHDMQAHLLASIDVINKPLQQALEPDRLSTVLNAFLAPDKGTQKKDDSMFSPPISLVPILAFNPIISAQARMVNRTCMKMFFHSHNLREHLSLQRKFQLLGNGVFSSRLSHALFDPELESAERHRGVARSGGIMGLRLGGRDNWPPASSELRLALMGVLTESYVWKAGASATGYFEKPLPGDLSFAVRDMSEEEIEKCMNPDSIEALDFLRLAYKPPTPLDAVITPMILFKYDQLFKVLLRVIRLLFIITALFRDALDRSTHWQAVDYISQRFRIEAHHFISSVSAYFFDIGIEGTWRIFERKLDQVEARIDSENNPLGQNEGLDKLRDYHERVLDRIMFALLLRKRQQPIMHLLEEIFALVLQFSKISRQRALGEQEEAAADESVKELYLKFRKKVGVFIAVCRGLSEKRGYGEQRAGNRTAGQGGLFDGDDLAEDNTISYLVTRLEMSNYYSKAISIS